MQFPAARLELAALHVHSSSPQHLPGLSSPCHFSSIIFLRCCCLQDLKFVGMMQYDGDLLLPANYLVPPPEIHKTSGEFLVHNGISTFACSETQKFGHVTFFWNGNRSGYFDSNLETYLEVRCACCCRCGACNRVPFDLWVHVAVASLCGVHGAV
jgi:hypothetical protein